jgi:uncharacterized protein (DUF58 family)
MTMRRSVRKPPRVRPGAGAPPVVRPVPPRSPGTSYLQPEDLRRLKNLLFAARTIVEGYYAGRHRSPFRGHSVEFADYREYAPGDAITDVDWKAYGRSDRLFIKLFEARTDMVVYPLLDASASMAYVGAGAPGRFLGRRHAAGSTRTATLSKFEYGCYLIAALAFLAIKQGDKTAVGLFGETLDAYTPPGGTFRHLHRILQMLERAEPVGPTNTANALRNAFPVMRQRGLLVVISDLLEDPGELFAALNLYRHRRFEIILFHVLHEDELSLPETALARFVDSETGQRLTASVPDIRTGYRERIQAHIDALRTGCASRRIDYNLVTTATHYNAVLERYLVNRAALT